MSFIWLSSCQKMFNHRLIQVVPNARRLIRSHHCLSSNKCVFQSAVGGPSSSDLLQIHRSTLTSTTTEPGFLGSIWNKLTFRNGLRFSKSHLLVNSQRLYMCMDEFVDHVSMMKEFDMPDTFNSWFIVTELHIWMLLVKLTNLGEEGKLMIHNLVKALWLDLEQRSKKIEGVASSQRKEGLSVFGDHLGAAMFSYDEGLLGDDKDLAAALWRTFFERKNIDPRLLESMVHYVRRQIKHLDEQDAEIMIKFGLITFLPLRGNLSDEDCKNKLKSITSQDITKLRR
ncbi:ubiquinol-cytochrome-c reductase complex assembly factor 1-like [Tubulanus polymorphus]|uniref:ubiquinol-cytochrome-c reductase complex assembly factor 1-like n=1 Tax=Tubulanus polymorphus TaxID=672921 RepID=UPI003DA44FAD